LIIDAVFREGDLGSVDFLRLLVGPFSFPSTPSLFSLKFPLFAPFLLADVDEFESNPDDDDADDVANATDNDEFFDEIFDEIFRGSGDDEEPPELSRFWAITRSNF
jgi:hypothetical protein